MQSEIAEVAGLAVDEEVVVGPQRGLHDHGAGISVGGGELAAAAVGGHPAAGVVHRPPVVAEAGVGGDAARQPARRRGRGTPAARPRRPTRRPAAVGRRVPRRPRPASPRGPSPGRWRPARRRRAPRRDRRRRRRRRSCSRGRSTAAPRRRRTSCRWRARAPSRAPASRRCCRRRRVPGAMPARTERSSGREDVPVAKAASSREAGLSGSRWSSTQSAPEVIVSRSRTVVPA